MRICFFSDIHGNYEALMKMLDYEVEVAELFVFVGDIFGYFYEQREIIDTFMSMSNLVSIKGNHEKLYLLHSEIDKLTDKYGSSYKISLTDKQKQYIEELPDYVELDIDGKKLGVFHGGPFDYLEQRVYPNSLEDINHILDECQYDYIILGHTHYQLLCESNRTVVINPGSLGQPRDGKGFSYCLLDTETGVCKHKNVELNISKLIESVEKRDSDKYVFEYLKNKYSLGEN